MFNDIKFNIEVKPIICTNDTFFKSAESIKNFITDTINSIIKSKCENNIELKLVEISSFKENSSANCSITLSFNEKVHEYFSYSDYPHQAFVEYCLRSHMCISKIEY